MWNLWQDIEVEQVAVLGNCEDDLVEMAYQYGRHVGIAFQVSSLIKKLQRKKIFVALKT